MITQQINMIINHQIRSLKIKTNKILNLELKILTMNKMDKLKNQLNQLNKLNRLKRKRKQKIK